MKKISAFLLACILLVSVVCAGVISADAVTVSNQEYEVYFTGRHSSFLCNKTSIGNAVGTEYFLTYTVESAESSGLQNGFLGTSAPETQFPYIDGNGMMYYQQRKNESETPELLMEGYTYFIKYTVTESGFRYVAARAKGDSSEYVVIERKTTDSTPKHSNYGYFGLWLGNGLTNAHLTDVRFYDAAGNDLGVWSPRSLATVVKSEKLEKDTEVDHWYRVEAADLTNLAISNEKPLTGNKMFIEFSVSEAAYTCNQSGIALSDYPDGTYPHASGMMKYQSVNGEADCLLLQPGADYLIVLEKEKYGFTAYAQITCDGVTTVKVFPNITGTYKQEDPYFSLWFGTGGEAKTSFALENFKIYDAEKNNLGVQSNNKTLQIQHFGAILDYKACEGYYFCQQDNSSYTLYADQSYVYENAGQSISGTYVVRDGKITLTADGESQTFDYLYKGFTANDNAYKRLYTYRLSFVAGNGTEDTEQVFNFTNGYKPVKPADPTLDGYTFAGWCMLDGTEYDFDATVLKSATLYAKWTDGAGITYLAYENAPVTPDDGNVLTWIICAAVGLLAAVVSALIILGGRKRANKKK